MKPKAHNFSCATESLQRLSAQHKQLQKVMFEHRELWNGGIACAYNASTGQVNSLAA